MEKSDVKYQDALRKYAYATHKRDGFICKYCGWDGSKWPNWLFLSWDHLLPHGNPKRDDPKYIVTACRICNEFCNRTIFDVEGKSPEEIVDMKHKEVNKRRDEYKVFWRERVNNQKAKEGSE